MTKGFTQKLWYEDGGTNPCYNGNIYRMNAGIIPPAPTCRMWENVKNNGM
ncbi:MAG: hypothetical protein K2I64_04090 [Muribaculaceae bacterium]|nr:hypothetical protein [Muribaculaceae bacterium]